MGIVLRKASSVEGNQESERCPVRLNAPRFCYAWELYFCKKIEEKLKFRKLMPFFALVSVVDLLLARRIAAQGLATAANRLYHFPQFKATICK